MIPSAAAAVRPALRLFPRRGLGAGRSRDPPRPLRASRPSVRARGGSDGLSAGPRAQVPRGGRRLPGRVPLAARAWSAIGGDPARVGVAGDSREGTFPPWCRSRPGRPVAGADCQVLIYPATDFAIDTVSHAELRTGTSSRATASLVLAAISPGRRRHRCPRSPSAATSRPAAGAGDHRGLRLASRRGTRVRGGASGGRRGRGVPRVPRTDPRLRVVDKRSRKA